MKSRIGLAAIAVLGLGPLAFAQTQITTGVIQGTVSDAQGAVVQGAELEARNLATNQARQLTTGSDGRFVFLQLVPGRYELTAKKAGFTTVKQENVSLTVGQAITLNLVMKVSAVEEVITVTSMAVVDTSRTEVSNTLNETTIGTTPVLGRKFEDLLTLTPGVSIVQGPDGDEITFSGQRGIFNNISLDGGDYNNGFFGEQMGGQRAAIDITLDAVKEFQVVATGANAEFGRTAGGVVNVITKSGTNDLHGSLFHFQRLEALTADTSDGKPLQDFHREQFGGTLGGPLVKDKAFFFVAAEGIRENLRRPNLSETIGTPCPVQAPTIAANQALINGSADCQRLALLNFFRQSRNQDEGQPIDHKIDNNAVLAKLDWAINPKNNLSISHNFNYSENTNQTFDVATYGNSANGIEGASKINVTNLNLFSTISSTKLNEFHITYSREDRPRAAIPSNVPADTAMGFSTTFRFGSPFFLHPNIDELMKRFQVKDNFSIVAGAHTVKFGAEWMHSNNVQVFRGFFQGRYIFDSVTGFLRYASPAAAGGFGPNTVSCSNGTYVTFPAPCPPGSTGTTPLLLYLQESGSGLPGVPEPGFSDLVNNEFSAFVQDKWSIGSKLTVNYGLRWEAQTMADTVNPSTTAYARFIGDPRFPSDGTIPDQKNQFQPRLGIAWDLQGNGKTVIRANAGIYYARHNMLSQAGSVTANGLQQQSTALGPFSFPAVPMPVWPNVVRTGSVAPGQFPLFTGVRVTARDFKNARTTSANIAIERELAPDWSAYVDFTWAKGVYLPVFLNINTADRGSPFSLQLGDVFAAYSRGNSLYRGGTIGVRKRFSNKYQLEANYVLSKDLDTDSNERDPFTDYTTTALTGLPRDLPLDQLKRNYGPSLRDIRHRFNMFAYGELPGGLEGNLRVQARSAQPDPGLSASQRIVNGVDQGRNSVRKENGYFSFDWRLQRPFKVGKSATLMPIVEMFNTFNNSNNISALTAPPLFDFNGFLRLGVGDPRQLQLAIKLLF